MRVAASLLQVERSRCCCLCQLLHERVSFLCRSEHYFKSDFKLLELSAHFHDLRSEFLHRRCDADRCKGFSDVLRRSTESRIDAIAFLLRSLSYLMKDVLDFLLVTIHLSVIQTD